MEIEVLSCDLLRLLFHTSVCGPDIPFHLLGDLIFLCRSRMAELSSALPPVSPHLKCRIHIIHIHSLMLETEMTASIEQTPCWPLLQEGLSAYFFCFAVIDSHSFFCYFSSTAIEILIPPLASFLWMISYPLVLNKLQLCVLNNQRIPKVKVPSDLLPLIPISIPVCMALCTPHLYSKGKAVSLSLSFSTHTHLLPQGTAKFFLKPGSS